MSGEPTEADAEEIQLFEADKDVQNTVDNAEYEGVREARRKSCKEKGGKLVKHKGCEGCIIDGKLAEFNDDNSLPGAAAVEEPRSSSSSSKSKSSESDDDLRDSTESEINRQRAEKKAAEDARKAAKHARKAKREAEAKDVAAAKEAAAEDARKASEEAKAVAAAAEAASEDARNAAAAEDAAAAENARRAAVAADKAKEMAAKHALPRESSESFHLESSGSEAENLESPTLTKVEATPEQVQSYEKMKEAFKFIDLFLLMGTRKKLDKLLTSSNKTAFFKKTLDLINSIQVLKGVEHPRFQKRVDNIDKLVKANLHPLGQALTSRSTADEKGTKKLFARASEKFVPEVRFLMERYALVTAKVVPAPITLDVVIHELQKEDYFFNAYPKTNTLKDECVEAIKELQEKELLDDAQIEKIIDRFTTFQKKGVTFKKVKKNQGDFIVDLYLIVTHEENNEICRKGITGTTKISEEEGTFGDCLEKGHYGKKKRTRKSNVHVAESSAKKLKNKLLALGENDKLKEITEYLTAIVDKVGDEIEESYYEQTLNDLNDAKDEARLLKCLRRAIGDLKEFMGENKDKVRTCTQRLAEGKLTGTFKNCVEELSGGKRKKTKRKSTRRAKNFLSKFTRRFF